MLLAFITDLLNTFSWPDVLSYWPIASRIKLTTADKPFIPLAETSNLRYSTHISHLAASVSPKILLLIDWQIPTNFLKDL